MSNGSHEPFESELPAVPAAPSAERIELGGGPNAQVQPPGLPALQEQGGRAPLGGVRWRLPLVLFVATCVSTFLVGGWVYCVALMTILVCHEAGHFLQARRYGVPASLPYFLPMPLTPIGTLGAVIAMDARVKDRRALFDIGITGPLAGLVPTLACCVLGLQAPFSKVSSTAEMLHAAESGVFELGEPLLFTLLAQWNFGTIPDGHTVVIGPLATAGWVGLLITAVNLFPIGQLDGGHVLYALLRRRAHRVAQVILMGAVVGVVVGVWIFKQRGMAGWTVMLVLLALMGPRHPPTANDTVPLGPTRIVLGWVTLAFLILGFTPNPFPGL